MIIPHYARASRMIAALWMGTTLAYGINEQGAFPFFELLPGLTKWQWIAPNVLTCLLVMLFPSNVAILVVTAAIAFFSQLAWHSWIGALGSWLPFPFLGLAVFLNANEASKKRAILDSLVIILLLTGAQKLSTEYLAGAEFTGLTTFSRLFPSAIKETIAAHAALAAAVWLIFSFLPFPLYLLGWRRSLYTVVVIWSMTTWYLHSVHFYEVFLVLPLWVFFDRAPLSEWRFEKLRHLFPRPMIFYYSAVCLFFLRYLYFRDSQLMNLALVVFGLTTIALSCKPASASAIVTGPRTARHWAWNVALCLLLSAPLFFPSIPEPFAGSYFSARSARYPPRREIFFPCPTKQSGCRALHDEWAFRWGYKVEPRDDRCVVTVYR